jgi:hypothetical protein
MLRIRTTTETKSGIARLNEELLREHGSRAGEHVLVRHKGKESKMQVEAKPDLSMSEIQVSKSDLEKLGAQEGVRLDVKFSK